MGNKINALDIISWLFGVLVFVIGLINVFWGNDLGFGVFIILVSFIYFPPVHRIILEKTGFSIHRILKIALGIFILWAALGVGELPGKIDMMLTDL